MNQNLSPRLIIFSGMPGAGRSTLCRELARQIPNAFCMSRDGILYNGLMLVNNTEVSSLPPFSEYVARDSVFPDQAENFETTFGQMTRVHHVGGSGFYLRHGQEQSLLIQEHLAEEGLRIGKVPIMDGFQARHIKTGKLKKFLAQAKFAEFPKYVIQVIVSEDEAFKRHNARAQTSKELADRARFGYLDRESFNTIMRRDHSPFPEGLDEIEHHLLDTTGKSIESCVQECLDYVSDQSEKVK
ncbi:MAG: AAA family ATPase [bacterium]|nr:AAA family ATPase [bacterium]